MIGCECKIYEDSEFWEMKWAEKIIKKIEYLEEDGIKKIKMCLTHDGLNYVIKGAYKRTQNSQNTILINFKSDTYRGSVHSSTESFTNSKSTMAEDCDVD
jgi:hypothetical protein